MIKKIFFFLFLLNICLEAQAQKNEKAHPVYVDSAKAIAVPALSQHKLIAPSTEFKEVNEKQRGINKIVPGKGLPKTMDQTRQAKFGKLPGKAPLFTFDAAKTRSTPSDPTGAVGPNYYVNAYNTGLFHFR